MPVVIMWGSNIPKYVHRYKEVMAFPLMFTRNSELLKKFAAKVNQYYVSHKLYRNLQKISRLNQHTIQKT